jgi:hypothetical protein
MIKGPSDRRLNPASIQRLARPIASEVAKAAKQKRT